MNLIELEGVTAGYGGRPLLENITFRIRRGERIALIGRNGVGKSTLLKVVQGLLDPDDGERTVTDGVRISDLPQDVPRGDDRIVNDVVRDGLAHLRELVNEYETLSAKSGEGLSSRDANRLAVIEERLNRTQGWETENRVESILRRMDLDGAMPFSDLSSGRKRRVLLAQALVSEPDVLLLDEPTNHLDIESITWLEKLLANSSQALLFITHDRAFLQSLATRIVEVERGRLFDWDCDYQTFLKRKAELLEAEAKRDAEFDRELAREETWIRQGIKARRTRNEGRVRRLMEMRRQRQDRRKAVGNASLQVTTGTRSGHLVFRAEGISFAYGDETIVDDVSVTVTRGDRLGLIGPNGCGKSTIIKLLLGQLEPTAGEITRGTNLQIAYFDQLREQIDLDKTPAENVADGAESVTINGQPRHVMSWLQDFLFSPERARTLSRFLSGGERNRLLLARLFLKPANLLVMDEPTNDLDLETLELLEERLLEFEGTLLLVSHDREFLNSVVTATLAFEGDGQFREYDGGYDDWLRQRSELEPEPVETSSATTATTPAPTSKKSGVKLSYREEKELEALPETIDRLETELTERHAKMANPEFYRSDGDEIADFQTETDRLQNELDTAFVRWEELEAKRDGV